MKKHEKDEGVLIEEPSSASEASHRATARNSPVRNKDSAVKKPLIADASNDALSGLLPKISEWRKPQDSSAKKQYLSKIEILPAKNVLIFRIPDDARNPEKTDWTSLPLRLKEVFQEILSSMPVKAESKKEYEGCYTFTYADENFDLFVIFIVSEGKRILFFKPFPRKTSLS